jgi:hypothetical protein
MYLFNMHLCFLLIQRIQMCGADLASNSWRWSVVASPGEDAIGDASGRSGDPALMLTSSARAAASSARNLGNICQVDTFTKTPETNGGTLAEDGHCRLSRAAIEKI